MQKKKIVKVAAVGVLSDNKSNILLVQRYEPEIPAAHLKWEFPGGTHKFGETLEQTVEREFKEETGLNVKTVYPIFALYEEGNNSPSYHSTVSHLWKHRDYDLNVIISCFYCAYRGGKLKKNDSKIAKLSWLPLDKINENEFIDSLNPFLAELKKFRDAFRQ